MKKFLQATNTKFIAGGRGFRLWVEADEDHPNVAETLTGHISVGRRVIVPESRFQPVAPIEIEEYQDAQTAAIAAKPAPGIIQSDDYPDSEEPADEQ